MFHGVSFHEFLLVALLCYGISFMSEGSAKRGGGRKDPTVLLGWFDSSQSDLKPLQVSEVLGKCQNRQGIPKNVMLGTKNIKIRPLGPELAHTKVTVGLHMGISRNWV